MVTKPELDEIAYPLPPKARIKKELAQINARTLSMDDVDYWQDRITNKRTEVDRVTLTGNDVDDKGLIERRLNINRDSHLITGHWRIVGEYLNASGNLVITFVRTVLLPTSDGFVNVVKWVKDEGERNGQ